MESSPATCPRGKKLHQSLNEILTLSNTSHSVLPYFIQYMDSKKAMNLVEFWLAVESFAHGRGHSATTPMFGRHYRKQVNSDTGKDSRYKPGQPPAGQARIDEIASNHTTVSSNLAAGFSNLTPTSSNLVVESSKLTSSNPTPGFSNLSMESSKQEAESLVDGSKVCERSFLCTSSVDKPEEVLGDAIEIYTTFIALNAVKPVQIHDTIRQNIEAHLCPEEGGKVSRNCFKEAQEAVLSTMEKRFYSGFLGSPALAQYQLQALACDNIELIDILNCPNASILFREFMEQEGCVHLLDFWYMAEYFAQDLVLQSDPHGNMDGNLEYAMLIYDKYISLQASESVGMSNPIRHEVEQRICDPGGTRWDSFGDATKIVLETMASDHFVRFKQSQLFLGYHSKLLHSVSEEDEVVERRKSTAEIKEDSGRVLDLDDPEELWKRPKLLFRFGYVDEMGTFVSEANLESFLRTREGKLIPEKKFYKQIGRQPSYSKTTLFLLPVAKEIIMNVKSDIIEFGTEVDMVTAPTL